MSKEQQELLDEVYKNYLNEWTFEKYPNDGSVYNVDPIKVKEHTKPQFEYRCKTDDEFSEKWGLTIEERKLSWEERKDLLTPEQYDGTILENGQRTGFGYISPFTDKVIHYWMNLHNIPTKLITITYNGKVIESYE
jgi:hypothetical protein